MIRRFVRAVLVLLLLAAVATVAAAWRMRAYLHQPHGGDGTTVIQVQRGSTLKPLLEELEERGVLERPSWLYFYARFAKLTEIRAGEYEVSAKETPLDILSMLNEGRLRLESFTIPEGLNRWEIRDLLAREGWVAVDRFDALCDDKAFLDASAIPGPTCEGYLFPETYRFARGVSTERIMGKLFATFRAAYAAATANGSGPLGLEMKKLTTLASIVEKETGASEERPRIACVFYNRMTARPPWRLQTDPTVIYAARLADPSFDGNLKEYHLRELDSPYNTYRVGGLPPGPIASPGRAALAAVVSPINCDDFFFVSMNNGRHAFCKDYPCHLREQEKWQGRR